MRIRHALCDDEFFIHVPRTWTVFHHQACFALRPCLRHFPRRFSFNAWRNAIASAAARADRDSSSEGLDDAQQHHERVQDELHDAVVLAETVVVDHAGLPVRHRVHGTEHF